MHYSPVRHSSAPEGLLPFDLHVLSIPPAFNLSHDQTLQFNMFRYYGLVSSLGSITETCVELNGILYRYLLNSFYRYTHPHKLFRFVLLKSKGQRPVEPMHSTAFCFCVKLFVWLRARRQPANSKPAGSRQTPQPKTEKPAIHPYYPADRLCIAFPTCPARSFPASPFHCERAGHYTA